MQTLHAPPAPVFREPARLLEVLDHADVLVLGGGPGGVGAALAAARAGARVVVVERFGAFGGTWTSGLLSSIMPYPHVKGVFHEIVTRLEKNGGWRCAGRDDPYDWRTKSHRAPARRPHGWGGTYDAEKLKVVLDEMILEAGVVPYFFLVAASVLRDRDQIRGVVVESKEGRRVITADLFIDATGDGDIAALAGVPVSAGRESDGEMQPMTMIFKMDGVDDAAATAACVDDPSLARAWQAAKRRGEVTVPRENVLLSPMPVPGQWVFNTTRIIGRDGTRVRDVSSAMIEGRRQVDEVARFLRRHIPGFAQARVSETAAHIGVRETRRLRCNGRLPPFFRLYALIGGCPNAAIRAISHLGIQKRLAAGTVMTGFHGGSFQNQTRGGGICGTVCGKGPSSPSWPNSTQAERPWRHTLVPGTAI